MTTANFVTVAGYEAHVRASLRKSQEYLAAGDLHQACEKGWGAATHMAKAVAVAQGWEYETHADFSSVLNRATQATGDDRLHGLRGIANDLHDTTTVAGVTSTQRSSAKNSKVRPNCWSYSTR